MSAELNVKAKFTVSANILLIFTKFTDIPVSANVPTDVINFLPTSSNDDNPVNINEPTTADNNLFRNTPVLVPDNINEPTDIWNV